MFICGDSTPEPVARKMIELMGCCYGAAEKGPAECTCWEPIYDLKQTSPVLGEPGQRTEMCADCAYRPDSPERSDDDRYTNAQDDLDHIATGDNPFWCHQGMRKPTGWRHPSGITVEADVDGYEPPIIAGVPYRADGTPGERCAGWVARKRQLEAAPP